MKKLEFKTSNGEFILEEASDKNLGRVLVKYMTEEQFAEVVDKLEWSDGYFMYYRYDKSLHSFSETWTAKQSFESLIKSLGWYLFENHSASGGLCNSIKDWKEAESKTLYNPILLKKI